MTNPPNLPPPSESGKGFEFPPLQPGSPQHDPYTPLDYPTGYPPFPPPVYPPSVYPPPVYPPPVYPPPYPGGYPYQTGYPGDPYAPYRPLKPTGTNGKAIAALVTSAAGLLCCGVPSIAGIILGIIAMRETKRTGQDGFGLAVAGVALGGVVVALVFVYIIFVVIVSSSGMPTPD